MRDAERIKEVAARVIEEADHGNQVVVAVSAMGKTTDNLLKMASEVSSSPPPREIDMLLATGEQISIAMLAMCIDAMGRPAISLTGPQVGIKTDGVHGRARITDVNGDRMRRALNEGKIIVVAGFQGTGTEGEITTLGRGGSDTTAVALAAALGADRCDIYTDVNGVYTADPRNVPDARLLDTITYDEMLELASLGAKVLHGRSVELAKKYRVPLRVLSSFTRHPGTLLVERYENMENFMVRALACDRNGAKLSLMGVPDRPGVAASIFEKLGEENISVDMIIQNLASNGRNDISFTVSKNDFSAAHKVSNSFIKEIGGEGVQTEENIAKISLVGVGMKSHSGVAARMFQAMAREGISIQMISTSEICISCLIRLQDADAAERAVHAEFGLGSDTRVVVP